MQLTKLFSLGALAAAISAVTVSYDTGYDDASRPLTSVSCSDGINGLITRFHWMKQGDIPDFPFIGGADAVAGYNSPACGTCWRLDYSGRSIHVLAIDHAAAGFNIALEALNALTGGNAVQLGRVNATATQVATSLCGI